MYHNKVTLLLKGIHRKAILPLKVTLLLNRHMYHNKATHLNKGIHRNRDIILGQR